MTRHGETSEARVSIETTPSAPAISVVFPLVDPRGDRAERIASWSSRQTYPRDLYQIVAVSDGSEPGAEEIARGLFTDGDELVRCESRNLLDLYQAGIDRARGEIIVFAEHHCVAAPDCLSEVASFFASTGMVGACFNVACERRSEVAELEWQFHEADLPTITAPGHWNKVMLRGFAARREVLRNGIDSQYRFFAEPALGARLHSEGYELGYVERARVTHIDDNAITNILTFIREYTEGEIAYLATHDAAYCEAYFGRIPEWDEWRSWDPDYRRHVGRMLRRSIRAGLSRRLDRRARQAMRELARSWASSVAATRVADRPRILLARLGVASAVLRYKAWLFSLERRTRAHADVRRRMVHLVRLQSIAKSAATRGALPVSLRCDPGRVGEERLVGFHAAEVWNGIPFRWTQPVAAVRLNAQAADYVLAISLLPIGGSGDDLPAFYWNGRELTDASRGSEGQIEFRIGREMFASAMRSRRASADQSPDATAEQKLWVVCPPFSFPGDPRRLGVAIASIELRPLDGTRSTRELPAANAALSSESSEPGPFLRQRPVANGGPHPTPLPTARPLDPAINGERLRIATVNTSDRGGGAERLAWLVFDGLRKLGQDSWMLVGEKKTDDADVIPFHGSRRFDYRRYRRLHHRVPLSLRRGGEKLLGIESFSFPYTAHLLELRGREPDIVHCHNLHGGYFDLRALAPLSRRRPVFLTLSDCWLFTGHCAHPYDCTRWQAECGKCPDLGAEPAIRRDATRFNRLRKQRSFEGARLYVATPSRWLMGLVERSILYPSIAESRVIPNGIDLSIFRPGSRGDARANLGIPDDARVVTFAANRTMSNQFKDYPAMLEAVRRAADRIEEPLWFLAIGEEGATEHVSNATIRHVPYVAAPEEMAAYYRASDVYLHLSRAEVFGFAIVEAMACGLPVVANPVGGVREILEHESNALLVDSAEDAATALQRLLGDASLRQGIGGRAAEHARAHYDARVMAERYLEWYREVLTSEQTREREASVAAP